ncbi:uncharacterized protein TNCT_640511 [Trichonephila clavata]|uniref:EF-hand domain-containing protein n=1 Tax=Trichonephila clavata TaxID=2740835 RepID=A0A8X6F030_TRICU|nr:uncharacterized protein TNCT_640511 [Trichonephila clavata]
MSVCHIKEDVKSVMKLRETGEMSQSEMTFYMIRMHDFDDNGGLDGIELRTVFSHSLEHLSDPEMHAVSIESLIDDVLTFDDDGNGIVDYGELHRNA